MELLKEIGSVILNSDITPTIGTTVTIRGIGGIGKSTIAKALCHDPLIKKHFVNGFLWISLTPPLPSLVTILSEIYQRLTDKSATPNASLLINKIKSLLSNPLCTKLLVILDDVWEAKDAMVFVDVFSNCKTILTTRKMDINTKIPAMVCFDIKPMSIKEAVKLLTLNVFEIEALLADEINRIQKLAKDLHCWPLLLNLVHGQLFVHCVEWNESPQDGILKVQQKLFNNGLTAFDPENQLEVSRENAVRASITASLELLTKNEDIILQYIVSSIVGFGIYTFKDVLSVVLQMESKQFDKCTRNLWCHGLLTFQDVTLPNVISKIPCIGVHEVIAQFINENMPDEFYVNAVATTFKVYDDIFYHKYIHGDRDVTNFGQFFLSQNNVISIPFNIRSMILLTKLEQIRYFSLLNRSIEKNVHLLQNSDLINSQLPSLKHMHKIVEQDCNSIHSLLAEGKYNETVTWAKQYFDNHPWKQSLETITANLNILLHSCNTSDYNITLAIKERISSCNINFDVFGRLQRSTICRIIGCHHVLYLVNAAASEVDVKHYAVCTKLHTAT